MKLLIAYDGSVCSDTAIVDLRRAGLPTVADVLVLSVAEVARRVAAVPYGALVAGPGMFPPEGMESDASSGHQLEEAHVFAEQAADRLRADFPGWQIHTEAWVDTAGSAIIRKAHAWRPDLIVVGSHGRSGLGRLLLGSVSQHVLHHVNCSVRISRHRLHSQERSIRLLMGVDGSDDAKRAVQCVAARIWPIGTEARVVGVLDSGLSLASPEALEAAVISQAAQDESRNCVSRAVEEAVNDLAKSGLHATPKVLAGKAGQTLVSEAEKWGADCVFVGARGLNGLQRILLGSVSTAVASHAHCSVEVVRPNVE